MKLQFDPNQQYQLDAVEAIVNLFESQPQGALAKPVRPLKEKDFELIRKTICNYQELKKVYQPSKEKG